MKKILSIVLVISWMIVIFIFSNQNSEETTRTTGFIYRLFGINTDSSFTFILIRKSAHIIEYLVLGLLIYNMFKNFNVQHIYICTILLCIIYSNIDEIHQLFIQGREGKIIDSLIDMFGCSIGLLFIFLRQKINKRLSKN